MSSAEIFPTSPPPIPRRLPPTDAQKKAGKPGDLRIAVRSTPSSRRTLPEFSRTSIKSYSSLPNNLDKLSSSTPTPLQPTDIASVMSPAASEVLSTISASSKAPAQRLKEAQENYVKTTEDLKLARDTFNRRTKNFKRFITVAGGTLGAAVAVAGVVGFCFAAPVVIGFLTITCFAAIIAGVAVGGAISANKVFEPALHLSKHYYRKKYPTDAALLNLAKAQQKKAACDYAQVIKDLSGENEKDLSVMLNNSNVRSTLEKIIAEANSPAIR